MGLKYYSVWVFDSKAAKALDEDRSQILASGVFPSRAAFARALRATGLMHESERSVSNHILTYGGDGIEVERSNHPDSVPEQVYVSPLNASIRREKRLPWPPKEKSD